MKKIIRILIALTLFAGIFISLWLIGHNHMDKPSAESYVEVSVNWSGASAEDVEEGIIRPIERAFSSLKDLHRIDGTAEDGRGRVVLVFKGDARDDDWGSEILQSIKRQLTSIDEFPQTAGDPQINIFVN